MSFDDYANHIAQKLKLATAIAVLRSKPKNLSTEEYLSKLRDKIESMDCDSDVTICSDDFNIDFDDVTKDFEYNDNTQNYNTTVVHKYNDVPIPSTDDGNKRNNADINSHTIIDVIHNKYVINNEMHNDNVIGHNEMDSQATNSNVRTDINKEYNKVAKYVEILQELKQFDNLVQDKFNRNRSNSQAQEFEDIDSDATYCESLPNTQINKNNNTLEETQIYSLSDFTPFYTHYSESQMPNITINPKLIHKNQLNENDLNNTQFEYSQNAQNSESLNMNQNKFTSNILNINPESNIGTNDTNFPNKNTYDDININYNDKDLITNDRPLNFVTDDTNMDNNDVNLYFNDKNNQINKVNSHHNVNYANDTKAHSEIRNDTITHNIADDDIQSNDSNDLPDSQKEIVPFKVIEELNKIKTYLKKRNDRRMSCDGSSDSGYRSDSQGRHSRNSLQISGSCLNQSAHSLLTYIITCSLTKNTYDITREVSRALGSLIDKLHEDELYPSFLEILLETITGLLTSIYEEDSCSNVLLSKDEKVQRVLLLNKSTHIQKYTIDKITDILESIDTEANEVAHTAKMENLCYVFHILEIILSKHKVEQSSQSQDSQDKVLKRSSITDIWRKKWNLTKEVVIENVEKKCALTKCSEVLNKMIVNCMEAYSLISFVALKCFNLLQV